MRRAILLIGLAGLIGGCAGGEAELELQRPVLSPQTEPAPAIPIPAIPAQAALDLLAEQRPVERPAPAAAAQPRCSAGERMQLRTDREAYAARVKGETHVYGRPGGKSTHVFGPVNENDFPMVFGVLTAVLDAECEPAWYQVQVPVLPNGSTGYVRASDVNLEPVRFRIVVDLSERRLELFEDGLSVLKARAAIGSPITPTPTGDYYVNQRFSLTDPWGAFGPAAIGVSAFSPVLQDWAQGGPIAIHGTNQPSTVGQAVSHGCVRLENDTVTWLFDRTPPGTPVLIRA